MADYYNLTGLTNSTNLVELFTFANTTVDGLLFGLLIIGIFLVMLMAMKQWELEKALVSSSFVCFILSSIMFYAGWLHIMYPLTFLIITSLVGFYIYVTDR